MRTRNPSALAAILAVFASAPLCLAQMGGGAPAPAAPAASAAAPASATAAKGPIVTALKAQWQGVRDKVVNICDIVPEEKLDFKATDLLAVKPTPDVKTFRELIIHIASEGYNILRPLGSVPGVTPPTMPELNALKTKAELMTALRASYDYQGKLIDGLTEASATEMVQGRGGMSPKWNAIVSLLVDNMDHYGNLVTYVRLQGLVPPTTAAQQAARGARGGGAGGGGGRGGPGGGGGAAPQGAPAPAPAPAK